MNPNANPAATTRPENAINVHTAALKANLAADLTQVTARVFRSNIPSCRYVFKNGKVAPFIGGKYITNIKHEIDELDTEIEMKHPYISANKEEAVNTIEPLEALKVRFFAEFQAAQAANLLKSNDAGTSEQGKLNIANSSTVSAGMAGSSSAGATPALGLKLGTVK